MGYNIKRIGFFFISLSTILLYSCVATKIATTKIYSVKNPDLSDVKYKKVLVYAAFRDLGLREETENTIAGKLRSLGFYAVPSVEVIPMINESDNQELVKVLNEKGIDGLLMIQVLSYNYALSYIPRMSFYNGYGTLYSNILSYQSYSQEYGGFYVRKPIVRVQTTLFDVKSGKVAWKATAVIRGGVKANNEVLINSFSDQLVKKLVQDGMLEKTVNVRH